MSETTPEKTQLREDTPFRDAAGNTVLPTATDAAGNERIVGRPVDNWQPAPVDPDPRDVEALERANAREAAASQQRQDALTNPELVGETAQPLVEANQARDEEHEALLSQTEPTETVVTEGENAGAIADEAGPISQGEATTVSNGAVETAEEQQA